MASHWPEPATPREAIRVNFSSASGGKGDSPRSTKTDESLSAYQCLASLIIDIDAAPCLAASSPVNKSDEGDQKVNY